MQEKKIIKWPQKIVKKEILDPYDRNDSILFDISNVVGFGGPPFPHIYFLKPEIMYI